MGINGGEDQIERDVQLEQQEYCFFLDTRASLSPPPLSEIPDARIQGLSEDIRRLSAEVAPSPEHLQEKDKFLERLQAMVGQVGKRKGHQWIWLHPRPLQIVEGCKVSPFGSAVNGFWTPHSDLDICLRSPGASTRASQIKILRRVASELSKVGSHFVEPRFSAALPIIHWSPRRPGMLACDISVNNTLALANSLLIGAYVEVDPRVREMGVAVKYWAKARGINDRSRGTLSSFSLILMIIHFLQRRPVPILPSLQDLAIQNNQAPVYIQGVDCRYCTDPVQIEAELRALRGGAVKANQEEVGALLVEFFKYYAYEYKSGPIPIRNISSYLHSQRSDPDAFLVVDNPFEVGKDVANVLSSQFSRIRTEFKRAHGMLSHQKLHRFFDMCQPTEAKN